MRSRNLKPSFFTNEQLAECDPLARLLFQGLWCMAGADGLVEDRPKKIKAALLPFDNCDVDAMLTQLHNHCLIIRYQSEGKRVIMIPNFVKHQRPHPKEQSSGLPLPKDVTAMPCEDMCEPEKNTAEPEKNTASCASSLNSSSLSPSSLNPSSLLPRPGSAGDVCASDRDPVKDAQKAKRIVDEYQAQTLNRSTRHQGEAAVRALLDSGVPESDLRRSMTNFFQWAKESGKDLLPAARTFFASDGDWQTHRERSPPPARIAAGQAQRNAGNGDQERAARHARILS